jgi:hypothetical protein
VTKNKLVGMLILALTAVTNPVQAVPLNTVAVGDTIGGYQITSLASGYSYDPSAQGTGFDAFGFNVTGPGPGITSFGTAVADADLNTFVTANVADAGFTLLFTGLTNHSGVDLVLFEIGAPEAITVKIGTFVTPLTGVFTGDTISGSAAGDGQQGVNNNLNLIAIDLADFGVGPGASVSSIVLGLPDSGADFALGATVVPVPAAVLMFGSGLIGLVGIARRRRS